MLASTMPAHATRRVCRPASSRLLTAMRHKLAPIARAAGAAVLVLAAFLYVLGLKPFAYGIWFQAEPLTVGLLTLGAAAGLCLLALDFTGHAVWAVFRQPPLLCLLALAVWSALVSPLQAFPARSWFGTPETGEGIFAFLALLALAALCWVLWPYRQVRLAMAAAAVASAAAIGGLNVALPLGSPWRPQMLGAYGGTVGPAVALIVLGTIRRPGWKLTLLAFLAGLPAVLFSQSKVALLLGCLFGPLACLLLLRVQRRWRPDRRRRRLGVAPLLAVAGFALIVAAAMVLPPIDVYAFVPHRLADAVLRFASVGPSGTDLFYSERSRGLLALAGFAALAAHPAALLWGFGWGSYNDLLYRHTFIDGVLGFQDGVWSPNWEGIGAGTFHVHSDPLEAVLAAGLLAGILYVVFLCAVVRRSRRAMLPFAAVGWFIVAAMLSEWYPSLLVYPFLAMAIAACCAPLRPAPPPPAAPRHGSLLRAACVAGTLLLAFGAEATATDALVGGRLLAALNRQDAADIAAYGSVSGDHGRGGVHLWWAAMNYVYFLDTQLAQDHKPTPGQAAWYARLLQEVDSWTAQGRAGIRLAALTVAMRNDLVANHADTLLAPLRQRELASWDAAVVGLIRRAPERTDVAVPELAWLAFGRHYVPMLGMCEQIFRIRPGDRVCMWYSGMAMLTDPLSEEAGFVDLRRALALGVGAVAPVTPTARQAVESHFPPRPQ